MEFHLVVAFLVFLLSNISAITGCYDDERTALWSFKSLLSDPSNRLATWQGMNCCNWYGIRCSDLLHVTAVDLRNSNPSTPIVNMNSELVSTSNSISTALSGTISPSLFTLTHIKYLDLSFNNFMLSRIPPGVANLTALTCLNLSNAMFGDSIKNQFANLSSLTTLDLSCSLAVPDASSLSYNLSSSLTIKQGSGYTYINQGHLRSSNLDWLQSLTSLRILRLTGFDLSEASKSSKWATPLSTLSNLRLLQFSNCKISGELPLTQFLNLSRLCVLRMDFNSLMSQIPVQLANMSSLSTLNLGNSNLQGPIPYLPQLRELYVGNNPYVYSDLKSMFSVPWPKLEILDISATQVNGSIPTSISNATTLVSFTAYNCLIEGMVPSSLANLSSLETLRLDLNELVGQIPPSISNLKNLGALSLIQNYLQGSIPDSICNISSLRYLALAINHLTGQLPDCIGRFPYLEFFNVGLNSLSGTIQSLPSLFRGSFPSVIGLGFNNLTVKLEQQPFPSNFQPRVLELSSCNIEGNIPHSFSHLSQLSFLSLANNRLLGTIPSWLFTLPKLSRLDLSFNHLQGTLPPNIKLMSDIWPSTLNLAGNVLQGPIPSTFENIDVISLSDNNFTGYIPSQIVQRNMRYLSLADNKLVGQVPASFCREENALMQLDLSSNMLSGSVPRSLGNCTELTYLNIGQNNFSGRLPAELENLQNLSYLELTGNYFDGPFPSFIQKLSKLAVLKMGYNKFSGQIPTFIGDIQNLAILVLKSNFFNDSIPGQINKLGKLQIMDLSNNGFSGSLPGQLDGLKILITRPTDGDLLGYVVSTMYIGVELNMAYKGLTYQFDTLRSYHSGMDLSRNNLTGNIPDEIGLLKGLSMLNLSRNGLTGAIPNSIGNMSGLESLDLSFNNLGGRIPAALNSLDALSVMNLSYNNLSGQIPTGTRFDTWYADGFTYLGNKYLCGAPDSIYCSINAAVPVQEDPTVEDARKRWLFYGTVAIGFAVGFWGHFGVLYVMKEQMRVKYWKAIDEIVRCILEGIHRLKGE